MSSAPAVRTLRFDLDDVLGAQGAERPRRPVGGTATLHADSDHLVLGWDLRVAVPLSVPEGQRRFTDRLWDYDVVELFLGARSGGRYVEVEVAASGHWWAAAFTGPRARDRVLDTLAPVVESHWNANSWDGEARIDRRAIEAVVGEAPWKGLVAVTLSGPEPDSGPRPRIAIASVPLPGAKPDFHQPDHWVDVEV